MIDPDGIIAGPALDREPCDPDGVIGGAAVDDPPAGPVPRGRAGRPRAAPRTGEFLCWFVGDPAARPLSVTGDAPAPPPPSEPRVVAAAACRWSFVPETDEARAAHAKVTRTTVASNRVATWGYVSYTVLRWERLSEPGPLPELEADRTIEDPVSAAVLTDNFMGATLASGGSVREALADQPDACMLAAVLPWDSLFAIMSSDLPALFRSIRLSARLDLSKAFHGNPERRHIVRWKTDLRAAGAENLPRRGRACVEQPAEFVDKLLELPRGYERATATASGGGACVRRLAADPMVMINACFFRRHLRSAKAYSEARDAAWALEHPDSDEEGERDRSMDPRRSQLERAIKKTDVLDMLLLRRFFEACYKFDTLFSVNIWSDSSPASGEELQGMVIDVLVTDGTSERIVLPGSTLPYGLFDAVSKSIAVLHALWCICGPRHAVLQYVLRKVMSVTTDFGTEIHTLEMVDCSLAYCKWMEGHPADSLLQYVDVSQRWLPFAVRISGWSHTWGNIAKQVAESCVCWESVLNKVRAMVGFFHVVSWRKHIIKALALNPHPDFDARELISFTASFAHWRYETITHVFGDLLRMRVLCQKYMLQAWFANAQDRPLMERAFDAFTDDKLWTFMAVGYREVFKPVESDRHWGMVCKCHEQDRREGKKGIVCYWNSRKLPWAADYVKEKIEARKTASRALTQAQSEGSEDVHQLVKTMTLKLSTLIKQRLGYLALPPWTAARCRTQQGAKDFLEQVRAEPMEKHDVYTRWFMETLGRHVVARSEGEELHVDLENELDRLATVPLDESAGEGYHRDVTYEKKRASASSQAHLKQTVRRKGVFKRLKVWRRTHGRRGRAVLRWEWRNWKRIVQPNSKKPWRPVKWTPNRVYQRLYREDAQSEFNWNNLVSKERNVHRAEPNEAGNAEAAMNEFLRAQVRDGNHYSCELPQAAPGAAASSSAPAAPAASSSALAVPAPAAVHFQLLSRAHGTHRAHVMPTIETPRDVSVTATLALEVQWEQTVPGQVGGTIGEVVVVPVGDPVWVLPRAIAPMQHMANNLMEYKRVAESSATEGALVLAEPELARWKGDVMDPKCPVLSVIHYLKNRGWKPVDAPVIHDRVEVGPFDATEAIKFRAYLQCLVVQQRIMPLTTRFPSREPINYYKVLLAGGKAEPGMPAKDLTLVLNGLLRRKGKRTELLPIEDRPVEVLDPDGIICPGPVHAEQPGPSKKRSGVKRQRLSGPEGPPEPEPQPLPPVGPIDPDPSGAPGGPPGVVDPPPLSPAPVEDDPDGIAGGAPAIPEPQAKQKQKLGGDFLPALDGATIRFQPYPDPETGKVYANYTLKCPRPDCVGCVKTKGDTPANTRKHGHLEPLAFVHAWIQVRDPRGIKTHRNTNPSEAEVATYANERRDELQDLYDFLRH